MVRHSPFKDNLVIKRDRNGTISRDHVTGLPVKVQKMMLMCNPRVLHNHMIEHFEDATDGDRVLISESKLRGLLRTSCSRIKKMSAREKIMCGCELCIIFDDIHACLILFRKRYITRMKKDLRGMRDGRTKRELSSKLETYINEVCSDPNDENYNPKYLLTGLWTRSWSLNAKGTYVLGKSIYLRIGHLNIAILLYLRVAETVLFLWVM